jgi:hypothetical protein
MSVRWGRIGPMTTSRRLLALASTLAVAGLVASTGAATATVPASGRATAGPCLQRGPIPVRALASVARAGCSLVGRVVTDGRVSVLVPPAGTSVSGEGVGRHGDVRGLTVTNTGATVRAVRGPAASTSARRGSPVACKDATFNLEGHKWSSGLRYRVNLQAMPKRMRASTVVHQIKVANANMRTGRNSCHKPRLKTPASHYLGRTKAKPNIKPAEGPSCGARNSSNIVAFGNLPGGLLGWTCYWWGAHGQMTGADMVIDNGRDLVTKLPKSCTDKWDFEGTVTHEWGHAYGMAHTGSGHANLTMQHILSACSTYARTLGLGDWLGMNQLYGHRH